MSTSQKFIKNGLAAICFCLPLMWVNAAQAANTSCAAGSTCVSVGNGSNDPLNKEQWDETKMLRSKVNRRTEKEFDKIDAAFDAKDKCEKSLNLNAYWEPNTQRCLDVNSGRPIINP